MEPVTVWWARREAAHPGLPALLDTVERARRDRYLRAEDRDRFTLGVAITRLALAPLLGVAPEQVPLTRACADCGDPHGPPRVPGGPHLSVSHSGDRVAVAISPHGPLGVDVEQATARMADVSGHLLAPDESAADERALLAYWTRKEALLKATGDGLRIPLTNLHVTPPEMAPRLLTWKNRPDLPPRFTMRSLDAGPAYTACLALLDHPDAPIEERPAAPLLTTTAPR
ncbi:4'-phosphopantetheinyl transferase family protein [Actinomadura hibisca]|uniref:4'-phosphopantetheinyl transferase family protein n=1 Tax=Actinomadura hibisca TaxID=68565 RepID=UPI00083326B5|nr:4'-phosphopantetheinyl transferase superfamily protein [Actinomadura hibisca]